MTGKIIDRRVVPSTYEIFENDNNAKSITFTVSKINDGIDLTNLYAFVNIENEDFVTNKILLTKTVNENDVTLVFNMDSSISFEDGITKAQISFESSDLSIVYSTAVFYIDVKSSVDSYSNTQISAKALHDLQSEFTKTLDSVNDKVNQALLEAKENLKFAELKIDGVVYDGSVAREVAHSGPTITELNKSVTSDYDGETDNVKIYGIYNYDGMDEVFGNGIDSCVVQGVGVKVTDTNDKNYGKYLIRIQNSNGNYYEPLHGNTIESGNASVRAMLESGKLYIKSSENVNTIIDVPLKQNFKKNTYYNLKLKFDTGSMSLSTRGTTLAIALLNKTTLEEKKIEINHNCSINVPMLNNQGERFFSGEEGEICIRVYINTAIGHFSPINGMFFYVVIEESDCPCDGFPLREVQYTDIYLTEPLYKLENLDSETGQVVDVLYDELDLKNAKVIRRVRKGIVHYENLCYNEELEIDFQMFIESMNIDGEKPTRYSRKESLFRPTLKMKSPFAIDACDFIYFDETGYVAYLSQFLFGYYFTSAYDNFPVAFFYPLRAPLVEKITPIKIPYRKGINVFDIVNEFPVEKFEFKLG